MNFLTKKINLENKKIFLRVDFNLPLEDRKISSEDDFRIKRTWPTIKYILNQNPKRVIVASHLGRPEGKINEEFSLLPVINILAKLLKKDFNIIKEDQAQKELDIDTKSRQYLRNIIVQIYKFEPNIYFLENLRFERGEEENNENFSQALSKLCDIYINEAFSASHRNHASISGVKNFVKEYYYGFLFNEEIENLSKVIKDPLRPLVLILGGSKAETKLLLIKNFLNYADNILVGGVLANTLLHTKGIAVGKSIIEVGIISQTKEIDITNTKIHLPVDVITTDDLKNPSNFNTVAVGKILREQIIADLGPDTISLFKNIIKTAKTIVWNGTLGYAENENFENSSLQIAKAIIESKTFSLIGGGDTIYFLKRKKLLDKFSFVSTGGGAMLEHLAKNIIWFNY